MKRLITLLTIFGSMLVSSQMAMAKQVTAYFFAPDYENNNKSVVIKAHVWENGVKDYDVWPGNLCKKVMTKDGLVLWSYTVDVDNVDNAYIIFNKVNPNNLSEVILQTKDLKLVDGGYYTGLVSYKDKDGELLDFSTKDKAYVMVAKCGDKTLTLPMYASRVRDSGVSNPYLFTVGFKDDLLKGKVGDKWEIHIEGVYNHVKYGPATNSDSYGNVANTLEHNEASDYNYVNCNLKYYGHTAITAGTNNTFWIQKGDGASYTFTLNLGENLYQGLNNGQVSFASSSNEVSLYVNNSLYDMYKNMYQSLYNN